MKVAIIQAIILILCCVESFAISVIGSGKANTQGVSYVVNEDFSGTGIPPSIGGLTWTSAASPNWDNTNHTDISPQVLSVLNNNNQTWKVSFASMSEIYVAFAVKPVGNPSNIVFIRLLDGSSRATLVRFNTGNTFMVNAYGDGVYDYGGTWNTGSYQFVKLHYKVSTQAARLYTSTTGANGSWTLRATSVGSGGGDIISVGNVGLYDGGEFVWGKLRVSSQDIDY